MTLCCGSLANFLSKHRALEHQVAQRLPFMAMLEDDMLLMPGFRAFVEQQVHAQYEQQVHAQCEQQVHAQLASNRCTPILSSVVSAREAAASARQSCWCSALGARVM